MYIRLVATATWTRRELTNKHLIFWISVKPLYVSTTVVSHIVIIYTGVYIDTHYYIRVTI